MKINFTKMQGAANDYIYIDCLNSDYYLSPETVRALCDRHRGVGADGVIFIRPDPAADARMVMLNADGTAGGMCGNGIRCVARYLYDNGLVRGDPAGDGRIRIATPGGVRTLHPVFRDGRLTAFQVDMGAAVLRCAEIPVLYDGGNIDIPVDVKNRVYETTCVSMGNPHAVVFVRDLHDIDVAVLGPLFEHHPLFPDRVNASFVVVQSPANLRMRVWERGAGETRACGTGACAATVAAVLKGYVDYNQPVAVDLPGGTLETVYGTDGHVLLTGDAEPVFTGTIEV